MAQFTFEGDFENLSESQLKLVKSVLQKHGFNEGKVTVEPVGEKGDNYMANVKRFIHESDGATFKIIGKVAPAADALRKIMKTKIAFSNEITIYEEVIPKFNSLQDAAGIPANERVRFPVCYGVLKEEPNELILLEDLTVSNYEMLNRFEPLSNEAVRLVLKDLAIFHSLSYALKNSEPETYNDFAKKLTNVWTLLHEEPEMKMFFESIVNDVKKLLDSDKYKKAVSGLLLPTHLKKIQSYEKSSKYSVIQQGDCLSINVMFRLEDGKPVDGIMIDYQASRESNPASDLLYFIFNCTDYGTRAKHFNEWIDYYHKVLEDSLANYRLKSNRIFPRDQLDADLRRYGKLLLGSALMQSSNFVRESKDVVDLRSMEGSKDEIMDDAVNQIKTERLDDTTIMALKHRVIGLVDSALEFGLI